MPIGERQCCRTCWFNLGYQDEPGYRHASEPKSHLCVIRKVEISDPYNSYCANHTLNVPLKVAMPIGPIYQDDAPKNRKVWISLEDTPENRLSHLEFLRNLSEVTLEDYSLKKSLLDIVVEQLIEWREYRAIPFLRRIASWPAQLDGADWRLALQDEVTVKSATKALEKLENMRS